MVASPNVRSSKVQFDGALLGAHQFGRVAFATAAQDNLGTFIAPCNLTIKKFLVRVLASTTSSAAKIAIGNATASGTYRKDLALNAKAAGTIIDDDLTLASTTWQAVTMTKGQQLKIKAAAATAAGSFAACMVYVPTVMEA